MALILADIFQLLDRMAPPHMAEEWDNVGLQVGDPRREVDLIWVALDPSPGVVSAACQNGVGLLVTHHPLIFSPLKRIDIRTPIGSVIEQAFRNRLSIYAMHTNLDAAVGGLNDLLAQKTGMQRVKPLAGGAGRNPHAGIGRTGLLPACMSLRQLALQLKKGMKLESVRVVGDSERRVRHVAVSTGSGSSLLPCFLSSASEVFITGDLRYHDAREIEAAGRCAIDIGHFHSEHLMAAAVAQRIQKALVRRRARIRVQTYSDEKEPFRTI
jgi:dinuclear metal center YbgI/SA1388 family protein